MPITALPAAPNKISDDAPTFSTKADAWVAALATFTIEANALESNVNAKEASATASAASATASASAADTSAAIAASVPTVSDTSSTSASLSTGNKTFTTAHSGKAFKGGMKVIIARTSALTTTYMYGTVTSYAGTTLVVNVAGYVGSGGPFTDWTISGTGPAVVVTAGSGITVNTANVLQPSIAHSDTSSQGSVNNSGAAVIQDVTLDGYGHVTALGSATLTASTVGALPTSGGTMSGAITMGSQQLRYDSDTYFVMSSTGFIFSGSGLTEYLRYNYSTGRVILATSDAADGKGFQVLSNGRIVGQFFGIDRGAACVIGASSVYLNNGSVTVELYPYMSATHALTPLYDNIVNLGTANSHYCWENIYYSGTISDISDERLKNISPNFPGVSWVYDLKPIEFTWKNKDLDGKKKVGFSAQQVYDVLPKALKDASTVVTKTPTEDGKDYNWSMSKVDLIPYLVKIIQEQKQMIDDLTLRITALEKNN